MICVSLRTLRKTSRSLRLPDSRQGFCINLQKTLTLPTGRQAQREYKGNAKHAEQI
jgi:hypothetical protein